MKKLSKEEQLERLTKLVGAYIKYVRKNGKVPAIQALHKKLFDISIDGTKAEVIRKTMQECVAYVEPNGKARLYRDNRTMEELMPIVITHYEGFSNSCKDLRKRTVVKTIVPLQEETVVSKHDFSKLSDDELAAIGNAYSQEVQRREQKNRKREQLSTILALAEMSAEDLISLIEECK